MSKAQAKAAARRALVHRLFLEETHRAERKLAGLPAVVGPADARQIQIRADIISQTWLAGMMRKVDAMLATVG